MPFDPTTIPVGAAPGDASLPAPSTDAAQGKLATMASQHGARVGSSAPILPKTNNGAPIPQADPYYLYSFQDGTQAVMNGAGNMIYYEPRTGNATTPYTDVKQAPSSSNPKVDTFWGYNQETHQYEEIGGAPKIDPTRDKVDVGTHPAQPGSDGKMYVWDPTAKNPVTGQNTGSYVDSGMPENTVAAQQAQQNVAKTTADLGEVNSRTALNQQQLDILSKKSPVEIEDLRTHGVLNQAQADQINEMLPVNKAATQATTAKTGAETTQIQTSTDIAKQKAPGEMALTDAQKQLAMAEAAAQGRPTVINPNTDSPTVTTIDKDGNIQSVANTAYQPKDPARAIMDLNTQMSAKAKSLTDAVHAGQITQDQAQQQWTQWYGANVEPLKQGIQQAQQQQIFANQTSNVSSAATQTNAAANAQNAATNNYNAQIAGVNAATQQGTAAVNAAIARPAGQLRVGPGFGNFMNQLTNSMSSTKQPGNLDWSSALEYTPTDTSAVFQNATANALKNVSPMAAQITGAPLPTVPQGLDVNSMLSNNMNNYVPNTAASGGTASTAATNQQQQPLNAQQIASMPAFNEDVSGTTAGGISPTGGGVGGPFAPSSTLTSAPTMATKPTAPGLMNPGDPNYMQWLLSQGLGNYQMPQAA